MNFRSGLRVLVAVVLGLMPQQVASAQAAGGTVLGTVRDSVGRVLANAQVSIGSARRLTDARGEYGFDSVAVGTQVLSVNYPGHAPARVRVDVRSAAEQRVDVTLREFRLAGPVTIGPEIRIIGKREPGSVQSAPDLANSMIFAGAKSEYVQVASMDANLAEKTPRQIFARVPGLFV